MIAGIIKLLPLLNKAIDLVPDKNKITEQKADLEKEYGSVNIDLKTGEISEVDVPASN